MHNQGTFSAKALGPPSCHSEPQSRNLGLGRLLLLSGLAPPPQTPRFTRGDRETSPSLMTRWQPGIAYCPGSDCQPRHLKVH